MNKRNILSLLTLCAHFVAFGMDHDYESDSDDSMGMSSPTGGFMVVSSPAGSPADTLQEFRLPASSPFSSESTASTPRRVPATPQAYSSSSASSTPSYFSPFPGTPVVPGTPVSQEAQNELEARRSAQRARARARQEAENAARIDALDTRIDRLLEMDAAHQVRIGNIDDLLARRPGRRSPQEAAPVQLPEFPDQRDIMDRNAEESMHATNLLTNSPFRRRAATTINQASTSQAAMPSASQVSASRALLRRQSRASSLFAHVADQPSPSPASTPDASGN